MKNTKEREESGEVMLESAIIIPITLMIMIAMLSLGFLYYQKMMLTTVATEVAEDVAHGYKYSDIGLDDLEKIVGTKYQESTIKKIRKFRNSFAINKMESEGKKIVNEKYLKKRVKLTSLGLSDSDIKVESYEIKLDNIGRLHVEVTLSMKSKIFLGGALEFFHIADAEPVFQSTGRAECIDITAYAGHVFFVKYFGKRILGENGTSIANSIVTIINSVKQIAKTFAG